MVKWWLDQVDLNRLRARGDRAMKRLRERVLKR
jgi:hypothetical protein